jgi:hypothetical protein
MESFGSRGYVLFTIQGYLLNNLTWEMKPIGPRVGWPCDRRYRSRIAYPHWPATTHKEAFDQLCLLTQKHNCHHRYLAMQWWSAVTQLSILVTETPEFQAEQTKIANDIRTVDTLSID